MVNLICELVKGTADGCLSVTLCQDSSSALPQHKCFFPLVWHNTPMSRGFTRPLHACLRPLALSSLKGIGRPWPLWGILSVPHPHVLDPWWPSSPSTSRGMRIHEHNGKYPAPLDLYRSRGFTAVCCFHLSATPISRRVHNPSHGSARCLITLESSTRQPEKSSRSFQHLY